MKRSLFLFAILLISLPAFAQLRVTPKVGVNISALDTRIQDIDAEARVGWNAGFDLRAGDGLFFFKPGLHYYSFTARLLQDVDPNTDVDLSEETTIQSLKMPLNIGLRVTGDNGLIGVHVHGGLIPTYVLGVREKPIFAFDRDDLEDFTLGANLGVGVDVLFLTVSANYEIGMTNFFVDSDENNNILTLSAGLKF